MGAFGPELPPAGRVGTPPWSGHLSQGYKSAAAGGRRSVAVVPFFHMPQINDVKRNLLKHSRKRKLSQPKLESSWDLASNHHCGCGGLPQRPCQSKLNINLSGRGHPTGARSKQLPDRRIPYPYQPTGRWKAHSGGRESSYSPRGYGNPF